VGRADVAEQFIMGLDDQQQSIRAVSAEGLKMAPSRKHDKAATALFDRLRAEDDSSVYHSLLESLTAVATRAHNGRVGDLMAVLTQEHPRMEIPPLQFVEWKNKAARTVIRILGPENAIELARPSTRPRSARVSESKESSLRSRSTGAKPSQTWIPTDVTISGIAFGRTESLSFHRTPRRRPNGMCASGAPCYLYSSRWSLVGSPTGAKST
jgi:hypothetical protein